MIYPDARVPMSVLLSRGSANFLQAKQKWLRGRVKFHFQTLILARAQGSSPARARRQATSLDLDLDLRRTDLDLDLSRMYLDLGRLDLALHLALDWHPSCYRGST